MTGNLTPPSTAQPNHSLEVMIQRVVQGTASVTGDAFFSALVENLALALDVRNCAVSKLLEDGQLQTLGLFCDGQLQPSITYNPISGPCGIVLTKDEYYCPSGIQDIFPNHPVLSALEASSYVGVCLKATDGKILGNLLVIDSDSILESQLYKSILKIFAARAATELERQQATLELQQLNEELELRVEHRTAELEAALQSLLQTQAQLVQSEKMSSLGQLIAGIAHEINNPNTFIVGNVSHIANYTHQLLELISCYQQVVPKPTPEIQQAIVACDLDFIRRDLPYLLSSMQTGSERIQELVRSFRNFSRLGESEKKVADLHEGINSTLVLLSHRLRPSTKRSEIQVIKHYGVLPKIECCPRQLNQVFMSLLTNAIDAIDECIGKQSADPVIRIHTAVVNHTIMIRIADNGVGIKPDLKKHLFEPFFTTKSSSEGTGLGLAISYQIVVTQHQGKLYCQSSEAKGTEFTIEIPIPAEAAAL
ncbi:GHKL domain-containing protein [Leptolyngbya cf. ectocarpi LEGE 11479]|uniref:histidine kinase n=1 Tax=Leptolyngbya cf. ectocarpi LEGE 11479 TaxID=1828722 RepID=A0A928ZVT5_LEPEC|nr:ATP-binding protein [Leptolyngbya ectocarpi]MBE9068295.1 GHKL domain-containing protein [Leptolyngbya cf. ectocarpi LEGE 11479]